MLPLAHLIVTDPKEIRRVEDLIGTVSRNLYPGFTHEEYHLLKLAVLGKGAGTAMYCMRETAPEDFQPALQCAGDMLARLIYEVGLAFHLTPRQISAVLEAEPSVSQAIGQNIVNHANHQMN